MVDIKDLKEQLRDWVKISAILESLGSSKETIISNKEHRYQCVVHGGHNTNLGIYFDDGNINCYCYKCGFSGDLFELVKKVLGIGFPEALIYICKITGVHNSMSCKSTIIPEWKKDRRSMFMDYKYRESIDESPLEIYPEISSVTFPKCIYEPWTREGILPETQREFDVRFYSSQQKIVLPVRDMAGRLVGIRGRALLPEDVEYAKYAPITDLKGTTYKFPSSRVLYGLNKTAEYIAKKQKVIIFESEKAVMQAWSFGFKNCVGLFGGNLSESNVDTLIRLDARELIIALDQDAQKKSEKIYKKYSSVINISRIDSSKLPEKYSPTDMGEDMFKELYNNRNGVS